MSWIKHRKETFDGKFKVGDGVSRGFNGDAYPHRITAISDSGKAVQLATVLWQDISIDAVAAKPHLLGDEQGPETFRHECGPYGKSGTAMVTGLGAEWLIVKYSNAKSPRAYKHGWGFDLGLHAASNPSF